MSRFLSYTKPISSFISLFRLPPFLFIPGNFFYPHTISSSSILYVFFFFLIFFFYIPSDVDVASINFSLCVCVFHACYLSFTNAPFRHFFHYIILSLIRPWFLSRLFDKHWINFRFIVYKLSLIIFHRDTGQRKMMDRWDRDFLLRVFNISRRLINVKIWHYFHIWIWLFTITYNIYI